MRIKHLLKNISILLLICALQFPLFAQEKTRFSQRLEWSDDDYAYEYKVEIRNSGKSTFYNTEDNFIELKLSAGDYEYRVVALDFLGKEASVSEWVKFSVIKARTPVIKELKSNVVVSGSNHTTFDIPLDVSSITEETKVVLVNNKTKEEIKGHLETKKVNGEVIASKAVFPEVPEGDWYAKVTNPSGLFSESASILVEKTVVEAKEIARTVPKRIYIPSDVDLKDEEIRLKAIAEKEEAEKSSLIEEERLAEEKRLEEQRIAEEKRLAEQKKLEEERLAEEKRFEEERIAEEKRLAEQKKLEEERLAEEKRLAEETRLEEDRKLEEQRIAEARMAEEKRLEDLANAEAQELWRRSEENDSVLEEVRTLEEELERTTKALEIAKEIDAPEVQVLEERIAIIEERMSLAQNAARLAAISLSYSQESLRITNELKDIAAYANENNNTVIDLQDLKVEADNASLLAQQTYEQVEKEREILDKKLAASQKSIDKKIAHLENVKKPVKNFNIMLGGDCLFSPYDKNLFSYSDYPVYGAIETQIEFTPIHFGENLFGFNFDFEITDFFSNGSNLSMHIPVIQAQLGVDYKHKLITDVLYADFTLAGGIVGLGRSAKYDASALRENQTMHFYLYPCATVSAGLYIIPAKHFAIETGGKFTHKFVTGMPTGTLEAYLLFGVRF